MFSMQPCPGLPWCSHTSDSPHGHDFLWLTAPSEPTDRDCLKRALVARQPSLAVGQWDEDMVPQPPHTPGFPLLAALGNSPTLADRFVRTLFFSFSFYFSTLTLNFLTEGLRLSEVTPRGISAHCRDGSLIRSI